MKNLILIVLFQPCLAFAGWGFFAHQKINKMAVYVLPEQMNGFFLKNIAQLEADAVKADQRRYTNPKEAPKYYIDIDYYSVDSPLVCQISHPPPSKINSACFIWSFQIVGDQTVHTVSCGVGPTTSSKLPFSMVWACACKKLKHTSI